MLQFPEFDLWKGTETLGIKVVFFFPSVYRGLYLFNGANITSVPSENRNIKDWLNVMVMETTL